MEYFYCYILRCADGSFYTGHTDNLVKRFAEHQAGTFGGYTSKRLPVERVFSEEFTTRDDAFFAEQKIKKWSRAKKEALIPRKWSLLRELAQRSTKKRHTKTEK